MESDQKYQIQLTEKALYQYNQILRQEEEVAQLQATKISSVSQTSQPNLSQAQAMPFLSAKQTIGQNFSSGLALLKDRVIKPLLVATEKVVEYYFPEDPKQAAAEQESLINLAATEQHQKVIDLKPKEGAAGYATKAGTVVNDDQTSVNSYETEIGKVKRRLAKLTMNGDSTNSLLDSDCGGARSPKSSASGPAVAKNSSASNLKKRRFRQLERSDIFDAINDCEDD